MAKHSLYLHPSLLSGPFTIGGVTYRVERREVLKRGIEQRPIQIHEIDGIQYPSLPIDPPDWVVLLDLVKMEPDQ